MPVCVFGISKQILNLIRMHLFRAAYNRGEGGKRHPLPKICYTAYNEETWHSYILLEEDPKKYTNHVTHLLSSASISIFSLEISNFHYIRKDRYTSNFNTWFPILFTFFEFLNAFLINMFAVLTTSAKMLY